MCHAWGCLLAARETAWVESLLGRVSLTPAPKDFIVPVWGQCKHPQEDQESVSSLGICAARTPVQCIRHIRAGGPCRCRHTQPHTPRGPQSPYSPRGGANQGKFPPTPALGTSEAICSRPFIQLSKERQHWVLSASLLEGSVQALAEFIVSCDRSPNGLRQPLTFI